MTILDPFSCGFAKVATFNTLREAHGIKKTNSENEKVYKSRVIQHQFEVFNNHFSSYNKMKAEYKCFKDKFPKILKRFSLLKNRKAEVIETFSLAKWNEQTNKQKERHSIYNCNECLKNPKLKQGLKSFPRVSLSEKTKAKKGGLLDEEVVEECLKNSREEHTQILRKASQEITKQWNETIVERTFGVPVSLRNRNKLRVHSSYETKENATERSKIQAEQILEGKRTPRNHVGNTSRFSWEKEACIQEVQNYSLDQVINYSDLARRFSLNDDAGKVPMNSGQIMKHLLEENGCDVSKFRSFTSQHKSSEENKENNFMRIRKRKRRMNLPNVRPVSLPVEPTNEQVLRVLKEQIHEGRYKLGELIVPQTFEKVVLRNGELVTVEVETKGRKISMKDIQTDASKRIRKFMRLTSDEQINQLSKETLITTLQTVNEHVDTDNITIEELKNHLKKVQRTRHWMFWHDGSTIGGGGHLLITPAIMYDPAVFLTDEEYHKKYKVKINVQANVEKPSIYILARCPSTDQQLLYSDDRLNDIKALNEGTGVDIDGIRLNEVVRIFKGDHPAAQFEAGHQKGGNYPCHGCSINAHCIKSYTHSHKCKTISLQERVDTVLSSEYSKDQIKAGKIKLFDNMKKPDLIQELTNRNINFHSTQTQKHLTEIMDSELHGIQRLPSLMFTRPFDTLDNLNLSKYEILVNEPLHDISNHIKNIQAEIPYHVPKHLKSQVKEIITKSFQNKDAKNSADHRKSLLIITHWFHNNLKDHFTTRILQTLSEIQEILYLPDSKRTLTTILRLIITNFIHAMLLKINIDGNVHSCTERKFFGIYYHSLMRHSGEQYRLFSGRTTNTEKEESIFNNLKTFTKLTSNHHPDNVISNCLIRMQAKEYLNEGEHIKESKTSIFTTLYQPIKEHLSNSVIPFSWINKYPFAYQSLLEQIADYLVEGRVWWKEETCGILFFDKDDSPKTKQHIRHFRNTTIVEEKERIERCWKTCLLNPSLIPAHKIKVTSHSGDPLTTIIGTLCNLISTDLPERENASLIFEPNNSAETSFENMETSSSNPLPVLEISNISSIDNNLTPLTLKVSSTNVSKTSLAVQSSSSISLESSAQSPSTNFPKNTNYPNKKTPELITSTPVRKPKETSSEDIVSLKKKPLIHLSNKSTLCKSTQILEKLFGKTDFVLEFDRKRKSLKSCRSSHSLQEDYKNTIAVIETKLYGIEEDRKNELKKLELMLIDENKSLNVKPSDSDNKETKKRYDGILKDLKHIKYIKSELQL